METNEAAALSKSQPLELRVARQRDRLIVTWHDGTVSDLSARLLRSASRAASAVAAEAHGRPEIGHVDVRLANVEPVGRYGVRLTFSDGHDRGIFPFIYLRELAREGRSHG